MKINPDKISNIILDFGGVIYQIDHYKQIEAFKSLGITDFEMLYSQAIQSQLFTEFECGRISPEHMLEEVSEILGSRLVSKQQIYNAWNSILGGFSDKTVRLLEDLRKHYNLYLLSNTNAIHYELFINDFTKKYGYDFNSLFVKPYWSFKVGLRKPEEAIYKFVITDSNLNPAETLFIDDSPQNIKGSFKAGLPALLLGGGMHLDSLFDDNLKLMSH
jgi:putative hydrolase of the HAD superfamily